MTPDVGASELVCGDAKPFTIRDGQAVETLEDEVEKLLWRQALREPEAGPTKLRLDPFATCRPGRMSGRGKSASGNYRNPQVEDGADHWP